MGNDIHSDSFPLYHIAFYKFAQVVNPEAAAQRLRELTEVIKGSILIATEGINGMLAGSAMQLDSFEASLQADPVFDGAFKGIVFKRTECKTVPFKRMKVHVKKEIVPLGIPGVDGAKTGIDVSPEEWRKLIARDDVVLIDNRNSFEFNLGRFKNAIDPNVVNFRDFPKYMEDNVTQWQAEGKTIAMYCTGGIRCEKTSAWMKQKGVDIYQLEGGILNYFMKMPDAEKDWDGECFVFDNRVALDTHLQETDTTVEDVYQDEPDGEWRLARARRLDEA
jgi:UPF0176 protein